MEENEKTIFDGMVILWSILLAIVSTIINGWVISILWAWFVVPIFALPLLSIPQATGLGLLFNCTNHQTIKEPKDADTSLTEIVVTAILRPFLVLFIGWIVTWFL